MRKKISWEIEIPFDEYPDQVKNIYQKNYINLRKDFANWIDKISKNHADNIDWWSLFPSSRNPNFSNIYKYLCTIETLKEITNKNIFIDISTKSEALYKFIQKEKKFNKNLISISYKKDSNTHIVNFVSYLKSLIFQFYLFVFIKYFTKKKDVKYETLINTYPNNKLEKPERLFQFSSKFKKKNNMKYAFVPSFIKTRNIFLLSRIITKIKNQNYIFKEHYLNFSDLIFAFNLIFRLKVFKIKYSKFRKHDVSELILADIYDFKNFYTSVICLLNYRFVKRYNETGNKVKKAICWFENHELKGWNYGFSKYFPETKLIGYQGFTPLSPLMNTVPTNLEIKSKVVPQNCIIISKKYLKNIKEFNKGLKVSVGPSMVYQRIFKKFKKTKKIKFLVVLNEFRNINNNILKWINLINSSNNKVLFYIKIPKITDMSDAIKYYSGNKDMIFVNSFLPRLFEQTKFVITSGVGFSSIAMEALAYECSLLIPVIDPYDKVYLKRIGVPNKFYNVFENKNDFLKFFVNIPKYKEPKITKTSFKRFRNKFFNNVNESSFS
tara:strand:+ start:645 stop:2297 length:1653 start_codon:yes stop_codon:yes gene_type:complete